MIPRILSDGSVLRTKDHKGIDAKPLISSALASVGPHIIKKRLTFSHSETPLH